MNEPKKITLEVVQRAVAGTAAAFRCVTEYQPAGGPGDKVFPPTYEGGKYATEKRRLPGYSEPVECVLLDSVQSQANRMELALLETWERTKDAEKKSERFPLPVITVDFDGNQMPKVLRITSLETPHRIADALLRDSLLNGQPFRRSPQGARLDHVDGNNATALFEMCPTALVFGMWDSTGPRGGLGAKFQRALVSEIVGVEATTGVRTSSRIDPAQVMVGAGPLFQRRDAADGIDWTLIEDNAARDTKGQPILYNRGSAQGKAGNPSKANHGNVTPTIADGGVTIRKAVQTTVLSLAALRRLRFPLNGTTKTSADDAARVVLAALGLCAATLASEKGCDLRSRCQLHPTTRIAWELLDGPGEPPVEFALSGSEAIALYIAAVGAARQAGLPWMEEELVLQPSPQLVELVRHSQELAVQATAEEGEG
jgi:CRISPR-associated protein Csb1